MFARAKSSSPKARSLEPIKGVGREVLSHVMNSIAFKNYRECCSVDGIASALDKNPTRLRTTLKKLADQGYVTIEGAKQQDVFPTVAALKSQDHSLSDNAARTLLRKLKRA